MTAARVTVCCQSIGAPRRTDTAARRAGRRRTEWVLFQPSGPRALLKCALPADATEGQGRTGLAPPRGGRSNGIPPRDASTVRLRQTVLRRRNCRQWAPLHRPSPLSSVYDCSRGWRKKPWVNKVSTVSQGSVATCLRCIMRRLVTVFPPTSSNRDNILPRMIVWRMRGKIIIRTVLCYCVRQWCTVIYTHIWWVLKVNCWLRFQVFFRFRFAFCVFCRFDSILFAFVVLGLVSLV